MSLVVVGSTVVDIIIIRAPRLPMWPVHSEFTPANLVLLDEAPLITLGGNGANAAYVAACNGAQVDLSTNIGEDLFGTMARGWLKTVKCRFLRSPRMDRTATNITAANARHARATFFYPGTPPRLPALRDLPARTTHLLACGWPHQPLPQLKRFFQSLKVKGIFTAMDVGPFLEQPWSLTEFKPLFPALNLLLGNEYELNALTRSSELSVSLQKLRKHFQGHVVVKKGRRGALWLPESSSKPRIVPPVKVQTVNTVGAGDSFNGALLAALALKTEFTPALAQAVKVAAKVVNSKKGVLGAKESTSD